MSTLQDSNHLQGRSDNQLSPSRKITLRPGPILSRTIHRCLDKRRTVGDIAKRYESRVSNGVGGYHLNLMQHLPPIGIHFTAIGLSIVDCGTTKRRLEPRWPVWKLAKANRFKQSFTTDIARDQRTLLSLYRGLCSRDDAPKIARLDNASGTQPDRREVKKLEWHSIVLVLGAL